MTNQPKRVLQGLFTDVGLEEHVQSSKLPRIARFPAKAIFHLLVLPPVPGEEPHEEYRVCIVQREDDGTYKYVDSTRYLAQDWVEALSKSQDFFEKVRHEAPFENLDEPYQFELRAESNN